MKYPDDFNTPAFPAGKYVAVSRVMATAVMVLFVVIIALCGIIFWTQKTQKISPFLIAYNTENAERWKVVAYDKHRTEVPVSYVLQEALLDKFVRNWFNISDDTLLNKALWSTSCTRTSQECTDTESGDIDTCAIYCACSDEVFEDFEKIVLPEYLNQEYERAAIWKVQNLVISPVDSIDSIANKKGGLWKLHIKVQTNHGDLIFIGFARTAYDATQYPKTMGYYVAEFNTYRER